MTDEDEGSAQPMAIDNPLIGLPTWDLETYLSAYSGHTKISRLRFIANRCPELKKEALLMCYEELRNSLNVSEFREVVVQLQSINALPSSYSEAMSSRLAQQGAEQLERLEAEVKKNRSSMMKENIRISLQDYGDALFTCGDYELALTHYLRARDYCTVSQHVIDSCLNIIKASAELGRWEQVINFAARGQAEVASYPQPVTAGLFRCVTGLACLRLGRYKTAASNFLEAPLEHIEAFKEYVSPRDIALYAALCGMAFFGRNELRQLLMENLAFKLALEHLPELRDILRFFKASQPASWRAALSRLRNDMLLDLHLHDHVDRLLHHITEVAMVQFVSPYATLEMKVVAEAFALDMKTLEDQLTNLVMNGKIAARIDSEKKILYKVTSNARVQAFAEALKTGRNYEVHCKAMLLRALLQQQGITIAQPKSSVPTSAHAHSHPPLHAVDFM